MNELYKLKDMLLKELEEYGSKGELTGGTLEVVDKLAHAIKNLCKIIEAYEEEEYSGMAGGGSSYRRGGGGSYGYGGSYDDGGSYRGGSYARGRGRNARRDGMGRYSRADGDMMETLHGLMQDAPNDMIRQDIQRLADKISQQM